MRKTVLYMPDGTEKELPLKWCICGQCDGEGKSSAYLGAYSWDEMEDLGEDFIEDYFAGNYDRVCETCNGAGKVLESDYDRMSKADAAAFRKQEWDAGEADRIQAMERLCGA